MHELSLLWFGASLSFLLGVLDRLSVSVFVFAFLLKSTFPKAVRSALLARCDESIAWNTASCQVEAPKESVEPEASKEPTAFGLTGPLNALCHASSNALALLHRGCLSFGLPPFLFGLQYAVSGEDSDESLEELKSVVSGSASAISEDEPVKEVSDWEV